MKSALLVIDAQRIYTDPDSEMHCKDARGTIRRINKLIERFQQKGEPIILVRHVHRVNGSDLGRMFDYAGDEVEDFNFKEGSDEVEFDRDLLRPPGATEVIKTRYSAFA